MRNFIIPAVCVWILFAASCATLDGDACRSFYPFTATSNSPVTAGQTIELNASYLPAALYHWTGPHGFTSDEQSVKIYFASAYDSGSYKCTVSAANCEDIPPAFAGAHIIYPDIPCNPSPENKVTFTNGVPPVQFINIHYSGADDHSRFSGYTPGFDGSIEICLYGDSLPRYDNVYDIGGTYCGDLSACHANLRISTYEYFHGYSGDVYLKVYPDKITMTFCDVAFGLFSGSGTIVYYK